MSHPLEQLRALRLNSKELRRGTTPLKSNSKGFEILDGIFAAFRFAFLGAVAGAILWGLHAPSWVGVAHGALGGAFVLFFIYSLSPLLAYIATTVCRGQCPDDDFLQHFNLGQRLLCWIMLAWILVFSFNHLYLQIATLWGRPETVSVKTSSITSRISAASGLSFSHKQEVPIYRQEPNLPLNNGWFILIWLTTLGVFALLLKRGSQTVAQQNGSNPSLADPILPFSLWLGHSTGYLAELAHGTALAPKQKITLGLTDAAQNLLILGGIGSGKTTRAMHPFLMQLLDQGCGGLIFDIKGDFQTAVRTFASETNRPLTCIGPGFEKMNLLAGLTPEVASSFLKSAFLLSGKGHGDAFWLDTATELCRNTLGLLSFLPASYSLQGLFGYLFSVEDRLAVDNALDALLPTLDEKTTRLLKSYWQYHERIFDRFDEKVKAGVNATIAQVLSPFNHPDLVEAFCSVGDEHVPMEAVLDGAVYLVSLPLSVWGLGGKVVYSLIKLRFYNVMQQRAARQEWNQERPVFFMCDEFQEIVSANKDGLSDLNFWDKSRSNKTIGIISAQAISSFYAAIGDRDIAHALLQNFRQKLCFRTEDTTTLNYFHHLADKVEVERKSHSKTSGTQKNSSSGSFLGSTSSSTSATENTTLVEKSVLSPQLFRKLQPDQAIALLSINGHSMDDVMQMMAIYV